MGSTLVELSWTIRDCSGGYNLSSLSFGQHSCSMVSSNKALLHAKQHGIGRTLTFFRLIPWLGKDGNEKTP
jgi:hypothetical protein